MLFQKYFFVDKNYFFFQDEYVSIYFTAYIICKIKFVNIFSIYLLVVLISKYLVFYGNDICPKILI